jgi:hypothetical protein
MQQIFSQASLIYFNLFSSSQTFASEELLSQKEIEMCLPNMNPLFPSTKTIEKKIQWTMANETVSCDITVKS